MSSARPALIVVVVYVLLCAGFVFGNARMQETPAVPADAAKLQIQWHGGKLSIKGDVSSAAHEAILRQTASKLVADDQLIIKLSYPSAMPPGWALTTELTLRAIMETVAASATVNVGGIKIRGLTRDKLRWQSAAQRLQQNMLRGMTFDPDVQEIRLTTSLQDQCKALFDAALRSQSIEFSLDSEQINSNAFALLDELILISADCPDADISITGHTDNTGNETTNRALSNSRARAVLDYMVAGGIAAERMTAEGLGATQPLLNEDSRRARQLNRRIEFELSY